MLRFILIFVVMAGSATAQERRISHCVAIAQNGGIPFLHHASFSDPVAQDTVRITYVTHATFLVQTADGISIATDYTGYPAGPDILPDVVTMNHAHHSHWTAYPNPDIPHVLQGWGNGIAPADHYLELGELVIRNIPTDIRSPFGGVEPGGNSIFVFEVAGLCIGHLGHLHHEPTEQQYAALGRVDVVMAAVDGGLTVDLSTMIRVLKRLRSSIVIPMHWFGRYTLDSFLAGMADDFAIERTGLSELTVSLFDLPPRPTVMVLNPGFLLDAED
jgi:L-ascorbate metabolism protein UlaG (beta-lactamase superfamily)